MCIDYQAILKELITIHIVIFTRQKLRSHSFRPNIRIQKIIYLQGI